MTEKKRKFIKDWILPAVVILILYFTGLYRPVIAYAQRLVLYTGIIQPDTSLEPDEDYPTTGYSWALQSLDGEPVSFHEFQNKVIFLNFFATWCPPCIAEMPGIANLHKEMASDSIVFVIVSRDDSRETVRKFMDRREFDIPVYMTASPVPPEFQGNVLPTTYIIDPNGRIVSRHSGMADYNNDKVKDFLRELSTM